MNELERALALSLQKAGEALTEAASCLRGEDTSFTAAHNRNANGNGGGNGGGNGHGHANGNGTAPRADLLTGRQLGAIHAIGRRAGLSRDGVARVVSELTGKSELTQLSRAEASEVIDHLQGRTAS